jgi:CBS domain-containing protein
MKAAEIMTAPVHTVRAEDTVAHAVQQMLQRRISGLPVVDKDGRLVGLVTEGDFLRRSETGTDRQRPHWLQLLLGPGRSAENYTQSHARLVGEVMSTDVASVSEGAPLADIVKIMEKRHVKRVPVLRDGKVVGIVSRANLLHALAGALGDIRPTSQSDAGIQQHIRAELQKQDWAPLGSTNIIVRDGVVHLHGTIFDDRERVALKVLAEAAPGVKGVEDHLVWIEPVSGLYLTPPAA